MDIFLGSSQNLHIFRGSFICIFGSFFCICLYLYGYGVGLVQHNTPGRERLSSTVGGLV